MQAKDECRRAHFYVVVVPQEHVLFRFTQKNDGPTVAALLEGFKGYLHVDAATVYHELRLIDRATPVRPTDAIATVDA